MNQEQLRLMREGKGFIGALDQSGGSTPKALLAYGIDKDRYTNDEQMYDLIHKMRSRMLTSPVFSSKYILGVILFEMTMERKVEGRFTADYCWDVKRIVPFLKVDKGLQDLKDGVQLMKPFPELSALLKKANEYNIFGTKMRSVIKDAHETGIREVVKQQFEWAELIQAHDLMPIIEPEVDINCTVKAEAEKILKKVLMEHLERIKSPVMLKLTLPTENDFYADLIAHKNVLRVVALSGGYSREYANELLSKNHGMIASFSRALAEGLSDDQPEKEFDEVLEESLKEIYNASIS
ncbi:fructose bisphosphate aldolase [Porphyromonas pogonae]|uniref:fructose bisphosphate aldolase n=1 Tax=Porphyromonas pogonae TaxID=867595 RepID=UPI002E7A44E4|nr:fructose bisphosphate aldolase [Porphyromonas pogonae]